MRCDRNAGPLHAAALDTAFNQYKPATARRIDFRQFTRVVALLSTDCDVDLVPLIAAAPVPISDKLPRASAPGGVSYSCRIRAWSTPLTHSCPYICMTHPATADVQLFPRVRAVETCKVWGMRVGRCASAPGGVSCSCRKRAWGSLLEAARYFQ